MRLVGGGGGGMTAIGTTNHIAFDVPREDRRIPRQAAEQGRGGHRDHQPLQLGDGGHKPGYDPATNDGDVFVRSLYFRDPNGTLLEFACWTTTFDDSDVRHAPATAADARGRGRRLIQG